MRHSNHKLITCKALAHILTKVAGEAVETVVMDIALHVRPEKLRSELIKQIAAIEAPETDILLGYGLCGRGLEGVYSSKSRLILPKVDDCIGALLGSRRRHRQFNKENSRCYFLDPNWLDTELNIFTEIMKGMDRIPEHRRDGIAKQALEHYNTLAIINSDGLDPASAERIKGHARDFGLQMLSLPANKTLLSRLIHGPHSGRELVITEPGETIPLF